MVMGFVYFLTLVSCLAVGTHLVEASTEKKLILFSVATQETDGFLRFQSSVQHSGLDYQVIGMGKEWLGGDMNYPGGGFKVKLLADEMTSRFGDLASTDKNTIVMFTDSYDVIVSCGEEDLVARFLQSEQDILFSAEPFCWPDRKLAVKYPLVKHGKRYLNSGGFIGYASALVKMFERSKATSIDNQDDDQLFYTNIYLDDALRSDLNIGLDSTSKIFQNLNGVTDDVTIKFMGDDIPVLHNHAYGTYPCVVHGNGPTKGFLNHLGNYFPDRYGDVAGCKTCASEQIQLDQDNLPLVTMGVFIEQPTPFLEEFFEGLISLNYPKEKIDLFVHNSETTLQKLVDSTLAPFVSKYRSIRILKPNPEFHESKFRARGIEYALEKKSEFYFVLDSLVHLDNKDTLLDLLTRNKKIIAPMIPKYNQMWTNFWGAVNDRGYYKRSPDYLDIVQGYRTGVWNAEFITACYLIKAEVLALLSSAYDYNTKLDPDMSFAQFCRDHGIFMFVTNAEVYGHMIEHENYDPTVFNAEVYQIFSNRLDWQRRYIHENYSYYLERQQWPPEPCPDVYWFPIFSERFCNEFVAIMENFGQWSGGTNEDKRLDGGYENVPTRDIHMNQVGLHDHWMHILHQFVYPMVTKIYTGYSGDPPKAIMNFVVRYKPDEQAALRPHQDASTYTVNCALNRVGIDYQGGGAKFNRYDCAVQATRMGWTLLHPGRLTHQHEGLPTTNGTRYIMVSFIDP